MQYKVDIFHSRRTDIAVFVGYRFRHEAQGSLELKIKKRLYQSLPKSASCKILNI